MTRNAFAGALIVALHAIAWAGEIIIDDFETLDAWSYHTDGGIRVKLQLERRYVKFGNGALRIVYHDRKPHWGNIARMVKVPKNAYAIAFWLFVDHVSQRSAMHVWFIEQDGDGYVQQVLINGSRIGELIRGWYEVVMPLRAFRFSPRGNRKRQFMTVNKILLGCNFGDMSVVVDRLRFLTRKRNGVQKPVTTPNLQIERTEKGSIAILNDSELPVKGIASNPLTLANALRNAGYGVTLLRAGDLIDGEIFNRSNFDAIVLPYGATFPYEARNALLSFLKASGSFLAMGGYAFDNLVTLTTDGWQPIESTITAEQMDNPPNIAYINTRYGRPGDRLGLQPDQIGVFDPSYQLQHVSSVRAAINQFIIPHDWKRNVRIEGFSAVAMTGSNSPVFPKVHARWIPLLQAYDRYGRHRGPVGALVYNYAGSYAKSSWMFFGATNVDLFAPYTATRNQPSLLPILSHLMDALLRKTFLHELATDRACYRQGEPVKITVKVSNFGKCQQRVRVQFEVDGNQIGEREFTVASDTTKTANAVWSPHKFDSDFYRVRATLAIEADGQWHMIDSMETGFAIWDDVILQSGLRVTLHGNYLHDNQRTRFLIGTNQTGMMWYSANENPLVWQGDFAQMRDYGVRILRILHFSPFATGGYEGRPTNRPTDLYHHPKRLERQTDAIVQIAQKHRIIIFLSLHDWMRVELTDEELNAQRDWNEFWTKRYATVPGIMFDIQNEPRVNLPDEPHIIQLWNEYLLEKYGSRKAVLKAWRVQRQPKPFDFKPISTDWHDVKAFDMNYFKVVLLNRWVRVNADGIRAGDPDALFTVGYLPSMQPADKVLGAEYVSFSNMHFYGSLRDFPMQFKIIDRRFEGKSLSLGEFGAQEAHYARTHGEVGDRPTESIRRFLTIVHYAYGLGASFVANWDWKDFRDCVFPWGVNHPDMVPKPVLKAYRNMAMLFQAFEPRYIDPGIYFVLPDSHRLGAKWREVHSAIFHALNLLLSCHVNFNVINEFALDKLPQDARVLIYPIPYCPSDDAFARIERFVRRGGVLYFSGGIGFDELRQPTRNGRWLRLGLPVQPAYTPFDVPDDAYQHKPLTAKVGNGRVFYVPFPMELKPHERNRDVYIAFLQFAGVKRINVKPDLPQVHVFAIPTADGGSAFVIVNASGEPQRVELLELTPHLITTLQPYTPALIYATDDGQLRALEAHGDVRVDNQPVIRAQGHFMLVALTNSDVRDASAILFMPTHPGEYKLIMRKQWRMAVCEMGEFVNGHWRELKRERLRQRNGMLTLAVAPDEALDLFIIADEPMLNEARKRVAQLLLW